MRLFALLLVVLATSAPALADDEPGSKVIWLAGISVGVPQQFTISGRMVVALPGDTIRDGHHGPDGQGLLVELEPGLGGAKIGVGYTVMGGMAGAAVQAIAIRTWGDPWLVDENETYAGLVGSLRVSILSFSLAPLYRTAGGGGDWSALVTVGIGF